MRSVVSVLTTATAALAATVVAASAVATAPPTIALPALPAKPMAAAEQAHISAVVRNLLDSIRYKDEIPGFTIGIWLPRDGVYRASFGRADITSAARPKLAASFRIGSVSKTFTATVILQLVDEGRLSLNGTVRAYVPSLARKYPAIGSRTVAQLLGMRSGLPEYADAAVKITTRAPQRVWRANQLIALGMKSGPVKPAGARKSVYTNTNYVVLGQIAEAVTGTSFARLVRQRLIEPLRLRRTTYPAPTENRLPSPYTHGYVGPSGAQEIKQLGGNTQAGADVTNWNPSWGNAAGMMISTIDDLARWANGMSGNALLSRNLQRQRLATTPMAPEWRYGLGILTLVGGRWTGHEGGIPGYSTWALKDAKTGTVIVTSVNACCGGAPASLTFDLIGKLYPETLVVGPPLEGGQTYVLSPTTAFTPPSGWTIDAAKTVEGLSLTAVKPGVVLEVGDPLSIPEDQTFESWASILHDADAAPGTTVSALKPFTTTSGLAGFTWTSRSLLESRETWMVTNGKKIAKQDSYGSASAVKRVSAELDRMARSITMTAPATEG